MIKRLGRILFLIVAELVTYSLCIYGFRHGFIGRLGVSNNWSLATVLVFMPFLLFIFNGFFTKDLMGKASENEKVIYTALMAFIVTPLVILGSIILLDHELYLGF